ncbi:Ppx/GppA phosphatase family protein [Noviherbaspirillum sp. Root189]|uniref:Ppx/GppA phosphatase family protein n=1 Tax=Noviherbaspirillum sp. Root189 TaxID=1736487 RepID=UPI00070C1DB6|nr:Ppx/GppA phosphatase family protein [Noviherbaspirillum sp. Root189]KRB89141.1 exopolyphosphatase [Noviherbaspirillum sp. Root189]
MFAAVDLGSNSFRMHIGRHDGNAIRIVKTARDPIRLGAGLDADGNLTGQAMQAALNCLRNFRAILDDYSPDAVRVVATNTMRIAKNAADFLPAAEEAIGHTIEIISGEEEGRLIYMGVSSALAAPDERRLVIDIGGGSTELILGHGTEIRHVESFSIGTARHSESFFGNGVLGSAAFTAATLSARSYFEDAVIPYNSSLWSAAYGSSGTIRVMSDVIAKNGIGDGRMSLLSLEALRDRLIAFGHVNAVNLQGVKPERIIVMVGGLPILIGIMQEIGITAITAVDAGLRMGVLWDLQLRGTRRDRREQSVIEFMRRFQVDQSRAHRVASTAAALYTQLKPSSDTYARYLYWSALLHEIGMAVSHTGYHKHAAYMVDNADMPGFTTREQRLMSTLIVAQKGNLRKVRESLDDSDFAKAVLALRMAAMLMHSRIEADVAELKIRMKSRIELELQKSWLARHPTVSYWADKERGFWKEVDIDFSVRVLS